MNPLSQNTLEELQKQLKEQQYQAQEYAKQKKPQIYGQPFSYELEGKRKQSETKFGLKTIQDFLNQIQQPGSNYLAFDSPKENNILGHSLLLRDVREFYVRNVKSGNFLRNIQDDMAYIHVFGKSNIATYYINKKETLVGEVIDKFNQEYKDQIQIKAEKFGIGSRLEPGMQINENILKKPIADYVADDEGLIRLLSY